MNNHPSLAPEELEALWREAWRQARSACRNTIARLNAGHGGFYDADDFHQDLFLGFHKLALAWAACDPRPPESELWATWQRHLRHSGLRFYRRRPQRLWRGAMLPLPPEAFTLETPEDHLPWLNGNAAAQFIQPDEAQEALERLEERKRLFQALDHLPPPQRRLLRLVAHGWSLPRIARKLGIAYGSPLYQRLYRARRALYQALQRQS